MFVIYHWILTKSLVISAERDSWPTEKRLRVVRGRGLPHTVQMGHDKPEARAQCFFFCYCLSNLYTQIWGWNSLLWECELRALPSEPTRCPWELRAADGWTRALLLWSCSAWEKWSWEFECSRERVLWGHQNQVDWAEGRGQRSCSGLGSPREATFDHPTDELIQNSWNMLVAKHIT